MLTALSSERLAHRAASWNALEDEGLSNVLFGSWLANTAAKASSSALGRFGDALA
jgi:hypothetical protein